MNDLDASRISAEILHLSPGFVPRVVVSDQTASTNDDARQSASRGAPSGTVFFAEQQTAGRGRSGNVWFSPPGENLYFSVVLRPRVEPAALPPLALLLGLVVASVVDEALGSSSTFAGIKWPNDVLVEGKKISGLLLETSFRGGKMDAVVAGIGLNVHTVSFPETLGATATSLRILGARSLDRSLLAARLLVGIHSVMGAFEAEGLGPFHAELSRRDALLGVPLEANGARGFGAGIERDGSLCVRNEAGVLVHVGSGGVTPLGPFVSPRIVGAGVSGTHG